MCIRDSNPNPSCPQLSIAQSLMTTAAEEFRGLYQQPKLMYACRLVICCLGCVLGLPFVTQGGEHILDLVDTAIIQLPTLTVCVCELVAIVYVYGLCLRLCTVCVSDYGLC